MGKRSKGEKKDKVKSKKKKIDSDLSNVNLNNEDVKDDTVSNYVESTGNGNNKKIVFDNDDRCKTTCSERSATSSKRVRNKTITDTKLFTENHNDKQNQINEHVMNSNEPVEDTKTKIGSIKDGGPLSEEQVSDEEIDKFCDALDEEDNVQYENWVKLVEAKLAPNKKK